MKLITKLLLGMMLVVPTLHAAEGGGYEEEEYAAGEAPVPPTQSAYEQKARSALFMGQRAIDERAQQRARSAASPSGLLSPEELKAKIASGQLTEAELLFVPGLDVAAAMRMHAQEGPARLTSSLATPLSIAGLPEQVSLSNIPAAMLKKLCKQDQPAFLLARETWNLECNQAITLYKKKLEETRKVLGQLARIYITAKITGQFDEANDPLIQAIIQTLAELPEEPVSLHGVQRTATSLKDAQKQVAALDQRLLTPAMRETINDIMHPTSALIADDAIAKLPDIIRYYKRVEGIINVVASAPRIRKLVSDKNDIIKDAISTIHNGIAQGKQDSVIIDEATEDVYSWAVSRLS